MSNSDPNPHTAAPAGSEAVSVLAHTAPSKDHIRDELLAFWDGSSPLNLATLFIWYGKGASLADVGISDDEAANHVNKYNSIIVRAPGRGPLVTSSLASQWAQRAMSAIVSDVAERSAP